MSLCVLADGLGVAADLRHAALQTWARPSPEVSAAWLVRDSGLVQGQGHLRDVQGSCGQIGVEPVRGW